MSHAVVCESRLHGRAIAHHVKQAAARVVSDWNECMCTGVSGLRAAGEREGTSQSLPCLFSSEQHFTTVGLFSSLNPQTQSLRVRAK